MENYEKIANKKKKLIIIISAVLAIIVGVIAIISLTKTEEEKMIEEAIVKLEEYWKSEYEKGNIEDKYFEIKNTRVIKIKENDIEELKNVKYIIEFDIYSNWMNSTPYYENVKQGDNVVIYNDGTMEVRNGVFRIYRAKSYNIKFADTLIDSITDYHNDFNCIKNLK